MCISCGYNPCQCVPVYSYNWYNTPDLPCNPCSATVVCKKKIPAVCTYYNGPNLTGIGLTTNVNLETITATISTIIGALNTAVNNQITAQAVINAQILANFNDINARIVAITGIPHEDYVI